MPIKCINELRKVLANFWDNADLVGRCWEVKNNGRNPLGGSHITLMKGDEIITTFPVRGGFKC